MGKKRFATVLFLCLIAGALSFNSCATKDIPSPVAAKGPVFSAVVKQTIIKLSEMHGLDNLHIQVSPNNFWESQTRANLPFSSVLSDALAAELSANGALVTVQETGDRPLKLVGSYTKAGSELMVVVRLRQMGETASKDLAVAHEQVSLSRLDPAWLTPGFDRMGRTLVRLLELDYTGMSSLTLMTRTFRPANPSQGDLALGKEVTTYITHALAGSYTFQNAGTSFSKANAELSGTYVRAQGKMVFHAEIRDIHTGQKICGASFDTPLREIPNELMQPRIQNLDELARQAADSIILDYGKTASQSKGLVYIGKYSFPDTRSQAMVPVSLVLAEKFKTYLSGQAGITVTDDPAAASDLILSGKVIKGEDGLTLSASLKKMEAAEKGLVFKSLSVVQERLPARFCKEHWFDFDLGGKIDYMLHDLITDSLGILPRIVSESTIPRAEVMIHKFTFKETRQFSEFSNILNTHVLDFLSGSRFFMPVKDIEKRMAQVKYQSPSLDTVAGKPEATLAALVRAPYYIQGSFRPTQRGGLDIQVSLGAVDGRILSSADTTIPAYLTDRDLVTPETEDGIAANQITTFPEPEKQAFGIELMTQKGRHNLSFHRGEMLNFFVRSNQDVFLNIFTIDAQNTIYRIYPNQFTGPVPKVRANRIVAIPDAGYDKGFEFRVDPHGKVGNEKVVAFASDQPLPRLRGIVDTGFYGMTRIDMDIEDIRSEFLRHAQKRGASLSWDVLRVMTLP